jgi:exodeoxyribonuclease VIII
MTRDEYFALNRVNWSTLKLLRISPLHYRHGLTAPRRVTDGMLLGTAMHTAVFEPRAFASRHPVWDGGTRRGNDWEAFKAKYSGFEIITEAQRDAALRVAEAVRSHPVASRHLSEGAEERVITWTDAETGVECKGRADLVNGHLVDLKTTGDLSPRVFAGTCARLGYVDQLAFYTDGLEAEGYKLHGPPALVCVEQKEPHDVVVYRVEEDQLEAGRRSYRALLDVLVACRETNQWPGRAPLMEEPLLLPAWAYDEGNDAPITFGGMEMY